ncbi:hypothetical protein AAVH_30829 [Aphelenchoides avenae]|nr:hypothetical protein AAVH_30829 [Aphelenchus avenae]
MPYVRAHVNDDLVHNVDEYRNGSWRMDQEPFNREVIYTDGTITTNAQQNCVFQSANLPSIHSQDDAKWLINYYLSQKGDAGDVPLGIHYDGSTWVTFDGSSLNFTNWVAGDHDDSSRSFASFSTEDTTWQAQSGSQGYYDYICQIQNC